MVSVSEATAFIHQYLYRPGKENVGIDVAEGRIMGESVKADRDFPPFDRVAMDGIAIQFKAFEEGWRGFKVEGLQPAGQPRLTLRDDKNCIEVMTGAMLPIGCDTVIRYEDVTVVNGLAKLKAEQIEKGQSIHTRASDAKRGDNLLAPGTKIAASEVAILASVGRAQVEVLTLPKVAIISTGNELVDVHDSPLPHQIRRSNSYALKAALTSMGCATDLYHVPDDRNVMDREFPKHFGNHELVILSGGVSKGKFDFVPAALESMGVTNLFKGVAQKPGKPFWFGVTKKQVVFALPGNPVSSFLCFYKYIQPWILHGLGIVKPFGTAILAKDFTFVPDLTCFLQVKITIEAGKLVAYPQPGGGSGDFANLKEVDGFLELPAGKNEFKAGEAYTYIPFR